MYVGLSGVAYVFELVRKLVRDLHCQHEEDDTHIVWHVKHIVEMRNDVSIFVRANDTDVRIILIYHALRFGEHVHIWMDVGLSISNTRKHINVTQLAEHLAPELCSAFPAYHAFTGCDYTPVFLEEGKDSSIFPNKKLTSVHGGI